MKRTVFFIVLSLVLVSSSSAMNRIYLINGVTNGNGSGTTDGNNYLTGVSATNDSGSHTFTFTRYGLDNLVVSINDQGGSGSGTNGTDGLNGTGVRNASVLPNGSLQIGLTNGTILVLDNVRGSDGATGPAGPAGENGTNGSQGIQGIQGIPGQNGSNGTGIASIDLLGNGSLQINRTDGVNTTSGNLNGPAGQQGAAGTNGSNASVVSGHEYINVTNGVVTANLTAFDARYPLGNYVLWVALSGAVGQNLTLSGIVASIGNWSLDKASYVPWLSVAGAVGANITRAELSGAVGANITLSQLSGAVGENLTIAKIQNVTIARNGTANCTGTDKFNGLTSNGSGLFVTCSADQTGGGGGFTNGSTIFVASPFTVMSAGTADTVVNLNGSGFTWSTGVQDAGLNYKVVAPGGGVPLECNKDSTSCTVKNQLSLASYNGATPLTVRGVTGMSVNLLSVENVSGNKVVTVNASGTLNASVGIITNLVSCTQALETDAQGRVVCGTDATGGASTTSRNSTVAKQVRTSNVPTPIINLSMPVAANEYSTFECRIPFMANTSTSGLALSLNITATTNNYWYDIVIPTSATALIRGSYVKQNNIEVVGTAVAVNMANHTAYIRGSINTSGAGSIIPRYRSEINGNNVTIWQGADCEKTVIA